MRLNIFVKFLIAMIVFLVIAIAVFLSEARRTGSELLSALSHAKAESIADLGLMTLEHQMLSNDSSMLHGFLHSLAASHYADRIRIADADGVIVASSDAEDVAKRLTLGRYVANPHGRRHYMVRQSTANGAVEKHLWPIRNAPECYACHAKEREVLGYLEIYLPLAEIRSIAVAHKDTNIFIAVSVFAGLGLSIILSLLFLVVRPVRRLQAHINIIEDQIPNLHEGTPLSAIPSTTIRGGEDELSLLAQSFQNLIARLNYAYGELVELHHQQLERADQLATVGEMAASIAHEIKNPLSGVKGALQVFLKKLNGTDDRREIVEEMVVQLDRINRAVNDLLSYAREAPPQLASVEVTDVIERTATLLLPEIKNRDITLELDLAGKRKTIEADPQQLQQVLWNIMLNAVQAMKGGGTLSVGIDLPGDDVMIIVSDTGIGITEEVREYMFKAFFTTKAKGTGLGMAIVQRIIKQHGGKILIQSAVNEGTTVRIVFPTAQQRRAQ